MSAATGPTSLPGHLSSRSFGQADDAAPATTEAQLRLTSLTKRQREIAILAATGLTSVDIAQRLYLSTRTVNNHLQVCYTKLGIRGRGELAPLLGE